MSYVSELLMSGEKPVYQGKVHWIGYVPPAVLFVFALMFSRAEDNTFFGVLALIALAMLAKTAIIQKTTELAITNRRIVGKGGFIRRYTVELQHGQVESIQVLQTALGRIFNYGSLSIRGTGGSQTVIGCITAPLEFRKQAMEHIDRMQSGAGSAVPQNAGGGVPSLQDLIAMKEKGHITDEEFAQFKKKILAQ